MFRLADRIVVLRHGRVAAEVMPAEVHPDDVVALLSGQELDSSARRQLTRLHGLADRLVSADPSSSLSLILSALGAALGSERLCIHLLAERLAGLLGRAGPAAGAARRPGPGCRAARRAARSGVAAQTQAPVIEENARAGLSWAPFGDLARTAKVAASWSVPVLRARRAARRDHRAARPSRAAPSATTWTWSPSTPGTRRRRSSGTGCWTRSPPATGCWRPSGRCWRRWPGRCRWPTA